MVEGLLGPCRWEGTTWWLGSFGYWEPVSQDCLLLHPTSLLGRMKDFKEPESLGGCLQAFPASNAAWWADRQRQGKPWQPVCYPVTAGIAPIIQGTGCSQCPGHPEHPVPRSPIPGSRGSVFWKHCIQCVHNEILQDCCFINMCSLGIFLTIHVEKSLEGSHMEFIKLLHVVPAHPRTCLRFVFWISWRCHPPRYVNCLLHCYLQPKLLMMYPASEGSWALMSGVYNFCLYLVQKM